MTGIEFANRIDPIFATGGAPTADKNGLAVHQKLRFMLFQRHPGRTVIVEAFGGRQLGEECENEILA
ncbi:MAG: hypothetical protein AAFQ38_17260, partial [Pseudomonadota bacterium]